MKRTQKAGPAPAPDTTSPAEKSTLLRLIAERAYQLYEMRGGEHGHDLDDWLAAEREIATTARQAAPTRAAPKAKRSASPAGARPHPEP